MKCGYFRFEVEFGEKEHRAVYGKVIQKPASTLSSP